MAATIPLLTLEEHFSAPDIVEISQLDQWGPIISGKLTSLSTERIQDMDTSGVSRQIISHTPFSKAPTLEICSAINNKLHAAVCEHPNRFSGFATLPMTYPEDAEAELQRAVSELGFVGALVDNHTEGKFYDEEKFDLIWGKAQELNVPIYLHPSFASDMMMEVNYYGNYSEIVARNLSEHVIGWHSETALHFLRLFAAGLFDKFPRLKLILGHMGEMIPFMLDRQSLVTKAWTNIQRPLLEVWQTNIYVTTSGMFDTPPLQCLLAYTPVEHVLFSVDYPFSSNDQGRAFMNQVKVRGILTDEEITKLGSGNAEKLLGVSVKD